MAYLSYQRRHAIFFPLELPFSVSLNLKEVFVTFIFVYKNVHHGHFLNNIKLCLFQNTLEASVICHQLSGLALNEGMQNKIEDFKQDFHNTSI